MKDYYPITFVAALCLCLPGFVSADQQLQPGPWHYRSIPCVTTTVQRVLPRLGYNNQTTFTLQDFEQSGVSVTFNSVLGTDPALPPHRVSVTHYQGDDGNTVMINERSGDRVQLCFIGYPLPTASCNPDKDFRGRRYRVYDYRQHAQYTGQNSQHTCGGA